MIIVGGTYDEVVVQPDSNDLIGSGVRAAAALSNTSTVEKLITAVDKGTLDEFNLVASALRIKDVEIVRRTERVGFRYMTPISPPSINGIGSLTDGSISVDTQTALIFGMVEGGKLTRKVNAEYIVLDPQKPRDTEPISRRGLKGKLVIVANQSETQQLGDDANEVVAAQNLLYSSGAHAIVTKRGASGCLITFSEGSHLRQEAVGAVPSDRVWPIGSGDMFSAGFAYALDQGRDLVEAAMVGSQTASYWCATRRPDIPLHVLSQVDSQFLTPRPGRVYLAGPFFSAAERWLVETVYEELKALGVEVWSPYHEVGPGEDIARADLDGLDSCDAVLALLDHSDSGTIFEVGWAVAKRIPVVGFGNAVEKEGMKMLGGSSVELHRDLSTACYRAAWAAMGMQTRPGWLTN